MKTIGSIIVKVTYSVGIGNLKVSDKVYDALSKFYDEGGEVLMPDDCIICGRKELAVAAEWLSDNITESDAMDWEYEIESFEEDK